MPCRDARILPLVHPGLRLVPDLSIHNRTPPSCSAGIEENQIIAQIILQHVNRDGLALLGPHVVVRQDPIDDHVDRRVSHMLD